MYAEVVAAMLGESGEDFITSRNRFQKLIDDVLNLIGPVQAEDETSIKFRYKPLYDTYKDVTIWDLYDNAGIDIRLYSKEVDEGGRSFVRAIGMAEGMTFMYGEGDSVKEATITAMYHLFSNEKFSNRINLTLEKMGKLKITEIVVPDDKVIPFEIAPKTIIDNNFSYGYEERVIGGGGNFRAEVTVGGFRVTANATTKKQALLIAYSNVVNALIQDGQLETMEEHVERKDGIGLSSVQAIISIVDVMNSTLLGHKTSDSTVVKERKVQISDYLSLIDEKSIYKIYRSFSSRVNIELYMMFDIVRKRYNSYKNFSLRDYGRVEVLSTDDLVKEIVERYC